MLHYSSIGFRRYYSLNVKRMKWLLFKRVESVKTTLIEWKSPSKRMKIIPKRVKIAPKRVKITPKEWISLLGGSSLSDSSFVSSCPSMSSPKKWNSLFWSDFHSLWSNFHTLWNDFTLFEGDFHSIRVVFTLSTLLKSNHFTLFTLRE